MSQISTLKSIYEQYGNKGVDQYLADNGRDTSHFRPMFTVIKELKKNNCNDTIEHIFQNQYSWMDSAIERCIQEKRTKDIKILLSFRTMYTFRTISRLIISHGIVEYLDELLKYWGKMKGRVIIEFIEWAIEYQQLGIIQYLNSNYNLTESIKLHCVLYCIRTGEPIPFLYFIERLSKVDSQLIKDLKKENQKRSNKNISGLICMIDFLDKRSEGIINEIYEIDKTDN